MFQFIGVFFLIVLGLFLFAIGIIFSFIQNLFGLKKQRPTFQSVSEPFQSHKYHDDNSANKSDDDEVLPEEGELHINRKKIFTKDDGEYVDFEEIKE